MHPRRLILPSILACSALALPGTALAASSSGQVAGGLPGSSTAAAPRAVPRISARVLRPGAKGADVKRLQQLLAASGITATLDGTYGYATSLAVQRFQVAAALDASGVAGPATIKALRAAAGSPRAEISGGGLDFGSHAVVARRLGQRMPLARGMSGRDVRQLQEYLRRAGVNGAPVSSGEFGAQTSRAVRHFEAAHHRDVNGTVDAGDIYTLRVTVGGDALPGDTGDPSSPDPSTGLSPAPLAPGDKATVGPDGRAIAPEGAPEAVKQIIAAGNKIAFKPYLWGGGHGSWNAAGYDCSGSVSYALRGAGLLKSPLASYDYFDWGQAGKGSWVTIYTNSGHMYMVVAGIRFDTSGRGAKGSRWQADMRDGSAFQVRHPAGL